MAKIILTDGWPHMLLNNHILKYYLNSIHTKQKLYGQNIDSEYFHNFRFRNYIIIHLEIKGDIPEYYPLAFRFLL